MDPSNSDYIQVTTTSDQPETIHSIAEQLVERRLAACVQVSGPITSVYRWQGQVERSEEWMGVIKTTRSRWLEVRDAIRLIHHYETPEIIVTAITDGNPEYLEWISAQVSADSPD